MNILHHPSPKDFKSFRFRKAITERIETAERIILDELKPTRAQLTHGHDTALGSDCYKFPHRDDGLTLEGRETIRRMNELGVIVDIAHAGLRTALETIEVSEDPVINSHTACKTVFDDADNRNMDDQSIRSLVKKGGLMGIYVVRGGKAWRLSPMEGYPPGTPPMSVPNTFDDLFRHLAYAIEVAGIDHVGIGTDITYLPDRPPHALDWTNWPYWTVGMVCRGLKDEEIRKILGENFYCLAVKLLDKKPWGRLGPAD